MGLNKEKDQIKIVKKTFYFSHCWSDNRFKGTVVNCELASLQEGSLAISLLSLYVINLHPI